MAVYRDSSVQIQTLQRQANARQIDSNAFASGASLALIKEYNDNSIAQMDNQQSNQLFRDVLGVMQTATQGAANIYSSIKSMQ